MLKNIYNLLLIILITSMLVSCAEQDQQDQNEKTLPNIVILLTDDLGYGDLNSYGGIPHTPNIDALAQNGLKFTDFYSAAPNCSPARAGLLTGQNPNRLGIYTYRRPDHSMHLQEEAVTIAELLKQQGYATGMFGKWHLSDLGPPWAPNEQPMPDEQGFDYWLATENNAQPSHLNPGNFVRNGKPEDTLQGYSSHILAREANQWLDQQKGKNNPFFLYVPFHEPHKTIASPDSLTQKYQDHEDPEYQANVENHDKAVGKIMEKLQAMGEYKNTLIIYSSDNGSYRHGSNGNLRGYKGESFEGGVRVPGIIHWPARIQTGRTIHEPAGLIDVFPTLSDITNTSLPENTTFDGISLAPIINGENITRKKPLLWFFYRAYPEVGMRDGNYVVNAYVHDTTPRTHYLSDSAMAFIKNAELKEFKLYNIAEDPLQKNDISETQPELLDSLKTKTQNLFREIRSKGPYWEDLLEYNPEQARPKKGYMRNQDVRWDMEREKEE